MGNGTKIGLVLVLILVVVVFATLLDNDIGNAPSGREQARLNPELGKQLSDPNQDPVGVPADPNREIEGSGNPVPIGNGSSRPGGDPGAGYPGAGSEGDRDSDIEKFRPRDLANGELYNGFGEEGDDRIDLNQGLRPVDGEDPIAGDVIPAAFPGDFPTVDPKDAEQDETDPDHDADAGGSPPKTQGEPTVESDFPKTHEVVEGDVLWKLAEEYYGKGTLYTLIQEANNIADSEALKIGAKLTIPAPPGGSSVSGGSTTDDDGSDGSAGEYDRYTIQDGDTLYDIAADKLGKGSRWEEIRDANPGIDPDRLKVGKTINIPKK